MNLITQLIMKPRNRAATRKHFQTLTQQPGERVMDFMTRILQAAADCGYACANCNSDQTDEHARDQLMIGLSNAILQKEVMCKDELLPSMSDIVRYCAAFESATHDQQTIRNAGASLMPPSDVNAMAPSPPPRPQAAPATAAAPVSATPPAAPAAPARHPPNRFTKSASRQAGSGQFCHGCGCKPPHQDRQKMCPAWGKNCLGCGMLNHFRSVCRSTKSTVAHVSWDPLEAEFVPSNPQQLPQIQSEI